MAILNLMEIHPVVNRNNDFYTSMPDLNPYYINMAKNKCDGEIFAETLLQSQLSMITSLYCLYASHIPAEIIFGFFSFAALTQIA